MDRYISGFMVIDKLAQSLAEDLNILLQKGYIGLFTTPTGETVYVHNKQERGGTFSFSTSLRDKGHLLHCKSLLRTSLLYIVS